MVCACRHTDIYPAILSIYIAVVLAAGDIDILCVVLYCICVCQCVSQSGGKGKASVGFINNHSTIHSIVGSKIFSSTPFLCLLNRVFCVIIITPCCVAWHGIRRV